MKFKVLLALFLGIQLGFAQETIPRSILNHVAQEIDNICGDTWCEGDFNWSFDNLNCDLAKGTCEMNLTLIDQFFLDESRNARPVERQIEDRKIYVDYLTKLLQGSYGENDEDGLQFHYPKKCIMAGFKTVEDVIDGTSYSEKLYEAVSECVSSMEIKFYSIESEASLRKSLHYCSSIKVESVIKEKDPNRRRVNYDVFYDEYQTWQDLVKFTEQLTELKKPRKVKLEHLSKWNEPHFKRCREDIEGLYRNYFILGLNPVTPIWSPEAVGLRTFIFTRQNFNSRLKVKLNVKKD